MSKFAALFVAFVLTLPGRLNGDFVIASYQPTTTLLNIGGARVTGLFGQSFLTTDTGVLANIQLRLVQSGPSALGVQVRVHSTSGGLPSTVLGSVSVSFPALTATPITVNANFSSLSILLNANTTYAFSLQSSDGNGFALMGTSNNGYAGGAAYNSVNGGASWSANNAGQDDAFFIVSAVPEPTCCAALALVSVFTSARICRRNASK